MYEVGFSVKLPTSFLISLSSAKQRRRLCEHSRFRYPHHILQGTHSRVFRTVQEYQLELSEALCGMECRVPGQPGCPCQGTWIFEGVRIGKDDLDSGDMGLYWESPDFGSGRAES